MKKLDNSQDKKVLITGANGFVGSNLTKYLSRNPTLEVYAMVRPKAPVNFLHNFQFKENKEDKWFEILEADLLDKDSIFQVAKDIDVIIHLAGFVSDWGSRERFWELNVNGTKNVLSAASKAKVSKVLFLSSLTVHKLDGHTFDDESTPRNVKNFPYGETKKIGEDLVLKWANKNKNREIAIIRPGFIIYGPYDRRSFILTLDAMKARTFGLINGGKKLISYVYVENLCYGINQLIKAEAVSGAYNILDGNMTWRRWVDIWTNALDIKKIRLSVPYVIIAPFVAILEGIYKIFKIKKSPPLNLYRINLMRKNLAFANNRIKKEIGYSPPIELREGVERTIEFYLNK